MHTSTVWALAWLPLAEPARAVPAAAWGWGADCAAAGGGGLLTASSDGSVALWPGAQRPAEGAEATGGRRLAAGLGDVYAVACRGDGTGFAAAGKDRR